MKGRLTVGKKSANIIEGRSLRQQFALTTGPIDGHKSTAQVGTWVTWCMMRSTDHRRGEKPLTLTAHEVSDV